MLVILEMGKPNMKISKYSKEAIEIVKEIQKRFVLDMKEKIELLKLIDEILKEENKGKENV